MMFLICVDLLLDDYGKPELEPSYYDYDILDDADKGKNTYDNLNCRLFFILFCVEEYFKKFNCLFISATKCWEQMKAQTKFCLDY